jgi:hypothetical protein
LALTKGQRYYKKHKATEAKRTLAYSRTPKGREIQKAAREKYKATPSGKCANLVAAARSRARNNGLSFDLTKEWCEYGLGQGCALTGLHFKFVTNEGRSMFSPSIDKINPTGGYTQDNCRLILWGLNAFKGTGTDSDMLSIAKALVKHQGRG